MPEGHTVHRTANDFNEHFGGQRLRVDSPQGRFSEGASLVNGQVLLEAKAIGKQLFLSFESGLTVRIHLGIYGKWKWFHSGNAVDAALALPAIGQVRARFYTPTSMAELRGPTVCEVQTADEVLAVAKRLGPDPLNPDPKGQEAKRFLARVQKSATPIGLLLMNQEVISGIGNVYRAELLFRAKINPYLPGNSLSEEQIQALWDDSVALLKIGEKTGVMITIDGLAKKRPTKAERNFVYKREGQPCRICGTKLSLAMAAGRKLYFCASCQK
ncbi:MAG: Fpg/Nei family DNA glycosylase [Micrococcales bacterium]